MKISIKLDIPEASVYAGVVADALNKIAVYWDVGARSGDLEGDAGPISWDSDADDEAYTCMNCGEYVPDDGEGYADLCATCADEGEMQGDHYFPFKKATAAGEE